MTVGGEVTYRERRDAAKHGTYSGYMRHIKGAGGWTKPPCEPCRLAQLAYNKQLRDSKKPPNYSFPSAAATVQGNFHHPSGTMVEPRCPECDGIVVYNGTYFCVENGCGWSFPCPDPEIGKPNNSAMQLLGVAMYESLMERWGEEPDPRYLDPALWRY